MSFSETTISGIPDVLPNFDDSVLLETEWNPGTGPIGYKANALQLFTYTRDKYTYGNGLNLDTGTNTLSSTVDLQNAYTVGINGEIDLISNKPFKLNSIVAGICLPRMTSTQFQAIVNPDVGLLAYDTDNNHFTANKGTSLSPIYDNLAYLSDIPDFPDIGYGEMYFVNNITETTISTINTPVKVAGPYLTGDIQGFTQSGGTLTCVNQDTSQYKITATLTATMNLDTDDISIYIFKNGVIVNKSEQGSILGPISPGSNQITNQSLLELSENDFIEIYVENNTDTEDILVKNLNCIITQNVSAISSPTEIGLQQAYDFGNTITTEVGRPVIIDNTDAPIQITGLSTNSLITSDGSKNIVSGNLSGDVTTSGGLSTTLSTITTPGTFGDSNNVPSITVDSKGRITSVTDTPISGSQSFYGGISFVNNKAPSINIGLNQLSGLTTTQPVLLSDNYIFGLGTGFNIVYFGTSERKFLVDFSATVMLELGTGTLAEVEFFVIKGTTLISNPKMSIFVTSELKSVSFSQILSLSNTASTNNLSIGWINRTSGTSQVLFNDASLTLSEV